MTDPLSELDAVEQGLARRAQEREEAEREPEWEAVATGELELDEALAQRRAAGDDEDRLARAAAYFRPFDGDETGALVDSLLAGLGGSTDDEGDEQPKPGAEVVPLRRPEPEQKPEQKHDPGSSGFWWIPGGMLVAAAAAIAIWWIWPPSDDIRGLGGDEGPQIASREPLPAYVLETDGGLELLRGAGEDGKDPAARHRYRRASEFEWILRPKVDEAGEVGVRGFAFVDGSSAGLPLPALDELAQIAGSGAIRIAGTVEQLDLEPGRYTIALAVGRPDELPTQAAEVHEPAADAAWQVRRVELEIED